MTVLPQKAHAEPFYLFFNVAEIPGDFASSVLHMHNSTISIPGVDGRSALHHSILAFQLLLRVSWHKPTP